MKVCLVTITPLRGVNERIGAMLATLPDVEVRYLCGGRWNGSMSRSWSWGKQPFIPRGPFRDVKDPAHVDDCLRWADVVHFMNHASPRTIGRPDVLRADKVIVWQAFICWSENLDRSWPVEDRERARSAAVAEGWDRYLRDVWPAKNLPMLYDLKDPKLRPIAHGERIRRVVWAFMRSPHDPDEKGLVWLEKEFASVEHDGITRASFVDCLRRKAVAWVGLDDFKTPILHNSGFEFLALGVPCMRLWDEGSSAALAEVTGGAPIPFVRASQEEVRAEAFRWLAMPADEHAQACVAARDWMERHYDGRKLAVRYVEFYKETA